MSERDTWPGPLEGDGRPPELKPSEEPPETGEARQSDWVADHDSHTRDTRPAIGTRGGPALWRRAKPGADVALARPRFDDARWSFLFKSRDTSYAGEPAAPGEVAAANLRMRGAPVPEVQGPFIKPPVWTWEVPLYFWVGGVASGSAFVAVACDLAGDDRSAQLARKVAFGMVLPAPLLLIADLGRPERFLNMLRIFKPRSPMNMGAWCLVAFSGTAAGAVGADLVRRPRAARVLGFLTSALGGYLGSYTGVLLASTAVPLWARSRSFLGPIFIATASATGAAAVRLTLVVRGLPPGHPTGRALGTIETAAILSELSLSSLNRRRVGELADVMSSGRPGWIFRGAKASVLLGLSSRLAARRGGPRIHDLASVLYLAGGLAFRYAWLQAGKASATDDASVAAMSRRGLGDARDVSTQRAPLPLPGIRRAWSETVRRVSLAVEQLLRR